MNCIHDINWLMGTKDGIVCSKCHKVFPDFEALEADRKGESAPEITPEEPAEPAPKPEAPKTAKKSGTKGGKK